MSEFHPPVKKSNITGIHEADTGINRATVEVVDSTGGEFTLTVETAAQHDKRIIEDYTDGVEAEGEEPVFILPGESISVEDVDQVLQTPPTLLGKYLVEQAIDVD